MAREKCGGQKELAKIQSTPSSVKHGGGDMIWACMAAMSARPLVLKENMSQNFLRDIRSFGGYFCLVWSDSRKGEKGTYFQLLKHEFQTFDAEMGNLKLYSIEPDLENKYICP